VAELGRGVKASNCLDRAVATVFRKV